VPTSESFESFHLSAVTLPVPPELRESRPALTGPTQHTHNSYNVIYTAHIYTYCTHLFRLHTYLCYAHHATVNTLLIS